LSKRCASQAQSFEKAKRRARSSAFQQLICASSKCRSLVTFRAYGRQTRSDLLLKDRPSPPSGSSLRHTSTLGRLGRTKHAYTLRLDSPIFAPRPSRSDSLDDAQRALEKKGVTVNERARHDSPARAEMAAVQRAGGRFVTLVCDSEVYHSVADRWPEAVDVAVLTRYASAFANGALQLAQQDI